MAGLGSPLKAWAVYQDPISLVTLSQNPSLLHNMSLQGPLLAFCHSGGYFLLHFSESHPVLCNLTHKHFQEKLGERGSLLSAPAPFPRISACQVLDVFGALASCLSRQPGESQPHTQPLCSAQ